MEPKEYPTCEKWSEVHERAMLIEEFMRFLGEKKLVLATWGNNEYRPEALRYNLQNFIYEFFEIDPVLLEKERRDILENMRRSTQQ